MKEYILNTIQWGMGPDRRLKHISTQESGKTHLVCPFCSAKLTAIHGGKLQPHFRHKGKSCNHRNKSLKHLPGYDFHLDLEDHPYEFLFETLRAVGVQRKKITELSEKMNNDRLLYFCKRTKSIADLAKKKQKAQRAAFVYSAISTELNQMCLPFG